MPRDGSGTANGRSKTYEALVKSLFTNISHAREPEIPPRPQSRIGFRRSKPSKIKQRPQPDRTLLPIQDTTGATPSPGADSDEDTPDSDTSDEWSTDSDTSDTTLPNDFRPCSPVPMTPLPIVVPDAFPDPDSPGLTISTDLPMHPPPPFRPVYPHHGLSRSALQHQKWLWNTRYDEWMQWQAEVESAEAEMGVYGGISNTATIEPPPLRRYRASSPVPLESEYAPVDTKMQINEKIFPRTGDITALHDPQVARLDQTFCNYPLCTIQKVLFVCNMDTAARRKIPHGRNSEMVDHCSDSKATDAPPSTKKGADEENHAMVSHDLPALDSPIPILTKLSREQSWHTRWEVLTELVRMTEQALLAQGPTAMSATVTTPIGLPVVARSLTDVTEDPNTRIPPRFFFADPAEVEGGDGTEGDDDDEEDDYGEIILNPRFGLQRTASARRGFGHPFLHTQIPPLDTRSGVKALRS
ncbi:hypothetical protein BJV78DRAFT_1281651 [Lactifluus subvellereus]|nr:hypothetical protein BJV78DRAFT_1281651 [Lactifluus subvellereus]